MIHRLRILTTCCGVWLGAGCEIDRVDLSHIAIDGSAAGLGASAVDAAALDAWLVFRMLGLQPNLSSVASLEKSLRDQLVAGVTKAECLHISNTDALRVQLDLCDLGAPLGIVDGAVTLALDGAGSVRLSASQLLLRVNPQLAALASMLGTAIPSSFPADVIEKNWSLLVSLAADGLQVVADSESWRGSLDTITRHGSSHVDAQALPRCVKVSGSVHGQTMTQTFDATLLDHLQCSAYCPEFGSLVAIAVPNEPAISLRFDGTDRVRWQAGENVVGTASTFGGCLAPITRQAREITSLLEAELSLLQLLQSGAWGAEPFLPAGCAHGEDDHLQLMNCRLPQLAGLWTGTLRPEGTQHLSGALQLQLTSWSFDATRATGSASSQLESHGALTEPWRASVEYDARLTGAVDEHGCVSLDGRTLVQARDGPWRMQLTGDRKCEDECRPATTVLTIDRPSPGVTFDLELDFKPEYGYDVWGPELGPQSQGLCGKALDDAPP